MKENVISLDKLHQSNDEVHNILEETLRTGARMLLQQAIENEVNEYLEAHKNQIDSSNRRLIVRNGYLPERQIQTGMGLIAVKQPRVRDKNGSLQYSSAILPK